MTLEKNTVKNPATEPTINELKADLYRLKKTLSEIIYDKEENPAETEEERRAFNPKMLYTYLVTEAKKEKTVTIQIKDYLELCKVEATEENIAKVRAIAKDLLILCRTEEKDGTITINNFIQRLEAGLDWIRVSFSDYLVEAFKE